MHLGDERIQRLLDGELSPGEAAAARAHLADCEGCRGALLEAERAERQAEALMRTLDEPAPDLDLENIVALAQDGDRPLAPPDEPAAAGWTRGRVPLLVRQVAALAAALALASVAYAIPGSPVPGWVRSVVERILHQRPPSLAPRPEPAEGAAGIAVTPGADLVIEFSSRQTQGFARVTLTDDADLVIRAPSGAATFTSDVDRVVVDNRGGASFQIQVPRAAPRVEIRIEGVPVFLKEGARVALAAPAGEGAYSIPLGLP